MSHPTLIGAFLFCFCCRSFLCCRRLSRVRNGFGTFVQFRSSIAVILFYFCYFFFLGSSLTGFSPAFTRRRCWPRSSWRAAFRLRPPPIDGQSEPFTDSERVLPGFTGFGKSLERVLLDFTEFYWVFKGLHYVLLLLAGVLLGFIGFYRVLSILQSFTWF